MKPNPFARHGIKHLSPSSLNLYASEPAFWTLRYLHGYRDEGGPPAWRGQAIEAGLAHWLFKRDEAEAEGTAQTFYEGLALGLADRQAEENRAAVAPTLRQAIEELQGREPPIAAQVKVEHWFDGIEVPVIGYIDFVWPEDTIDLKTKLRMDALTPEAHSRQCALYEVTKQRPAKLLYATPKRRELRDLQDGAQHLRRLERMAHSVRNLLAMHTDPVAASQVFAPNSDSFYWKHEAAKAAALPIWG